MSLIIQPFDLSQVTIQSLLDQNLILPADGLKTWHASIFPLSEEANVMTPTYSKNHILTFIDDSFWSDHNLTILSRYNQLVPYKNGNKYVKSTEIGDYSNSVKRYTVLDQAIDYIKTEASIFLNIPKPLPKSLDVGNPNLFFTGDTVIQPIERVSVEESLFGLNISNPHVQIPAINGSFKHNNKPIIESIFAWINAQGVKYVYCINEYRPYVISKDYVLNSVYYTVKGSI